MNFFFRKTLQAKENYLNEFFEKYDLPEDDAKALYSSPGLILFNSPLFVKIV